MNRPVCFAPLALAIAGASARAQLGSVTTDSTVTLSLTWHEGPGANNNGVLDPGEGAVLAMAASFTNQNAIANFSPPLGTFGSGTIRGFGSAFLDIHGSAVAQGAWNTDPTEGYGCHPLWGFQANGRPQNGGTLLSDIEVGQYPPNPNLIMTDNPVVNIWTGLWTPTDYTPRLVTWQLAGNPAAGQLISGVMLQLSSTLSLGVSVDPAHLVLGSVQIPIGVPAPAASSLLLIAASALRRKRPGVSA